MTDRKYKRALVTGGAGFIGSHICGKLLEEGLEVVVIDNLSMGKRENVPSGAKLIVGDIQDDSLIQKTFREGIDVVFHEAAIVAIRSSINNFYNDAMTNVMGTLNILRAALQHKVKKLMYASSMAVYADNLNYTPIPESYVTAPIAPYGISKLSSEQYLKNASENNELDIVCLRYFNTYGENQTLTPYVGVITIFVNKLLKGEPPVIFGSGNQKRDFIYVKDIVQANIKAMYSDVHFGIYNVGTGIAHSVNDVANMLCNAINPKIKPVYADAVPGELQYSIADLSLAQKHLGYAPEYKLEENIHCVIDQYSK
ncbi:MAG TPA: NAD-dependent epimerase/dehydratase family protein [Spirochaetota bacterium]|nr:NAD-dependent epimerase/dehydratase family protein [Spirochaetota bacterium]HPV41335.1 NAD-dependent epimerase/dehydratase family protein [Spirochaetota bacterium]